MSSLYDVQTLTPPADSAPERFPATRYESAPPFFDTYAEETAMSASPGRACDWSW